MIKKKRKPAYFFMFAKSKLSSLVFYTFRMNFKLISISTAIDMNTLTYKNLMVKSTPVTFIFVVIIATFGSLCSQTFFRCLSIRVIFRQCRTVCFKELDSMFSCWMVKLIFRHFIRSGKTF